MEILRLTYRLTLFTLLLLAMILLAMALLIADGFRREEIDRAPYARLCFRLISCCLGFRLVTQGETCRQTALYVSNHVSWIDIPVLGGLTPLKFLSKAEVSRWPIIGWLATQAGTLFIERGAGKAYQCQQEIARTLTGGHSVLVFPEGTTTAGLTVLPFHGRLLHAARNAGVAIQPISIGYLRNGQPDPLAPFIDDDEFQLHLIRLLRQPAVRIVVTFHAPVFLATEQPLSEICSSLRETVLGGLKSMHKAADPGRPLPLSPHAYPQFPDRNTE